MTELTVASQTRTDTLDHLSYAYECAGDLYDAMLVLMASCPTHTQWDDLTDDAARVRKYLALAIELATEVMQRDIMATLRQRECAARPHPEE